MPSEELEECWGRIQGELRGAVTGLTFHLWLESLEVAGRDRDTIFIRAPRHTRTLVEERYSPLLREATGRVLECPMAIEVVGEDWKPVSGSNEPPGGRAATGRAMPGLNPKYTFDQFVIGDENRLAHAAALAVAEQPGQTYNPLFLYGQPGLGKTHLLHAIGNYLLRFEDSITPRYATSEEFTSAFVTAVRGDGLARFRATFRDVDVLLLDDVQFFADKARTQEELFHTFNALYEGGCQLVVSSDRPPSELATLERRLTERFASGLIAAVEPPSLAVRTAILRKRAVIDGVDGLDDETLQAIAAGVSSSVRALEGALIRVVAYASLRGKPLSPALADEVLSRLQSPRTAERPSIAAIQRLTAVAFGCDPRSMVAHDRRPKVAFARQVAMYLSRELTEASLPAIGTSFGGRNHATVIHAHRRITRELAAETQAATTVRKLKEQLETFGPDRSECKD
jgi:chromosomal replication initiator protein